MSEQYYYLLDGKENGPFSRAAMEGLLKSGKLNGAFVRSGSDQPWQLPEEVGYLGSEAQEPAAPSSTSTSPDPAALVFRSQRDIRKATRSGKSGTVVVVALLVGAAGAGVWWANQRGLMPDQLSNILPLSDGAGDVTEYVRDENGNLSVRELRDGKQISIQTIEVPSREQTNTQNKLSDAGYAYDKRAASCQSVHLDLIGPPPSDPRCANVYQATVRGIQMACQQLQNIEMLGSQTAMASHPQYAEAMDRHMSGPLQSIERNVEGYNRISLSLGCQ